MKRCTNCESEVGQGQVMCQTCGSPLVQDEGKVCPFCQTYCGPFAKVCSSCGHPLFTEQQEEKRVVIEAEPAKSNVIPFEDAKKLKKKKQKQVKKQQRRPQKIGQVLLTGALIVFFILGVLSMFLR